MSAYKYMRDAWKQPDQKLQRERYTLWRSEPRFTRVPKPTRIDRARSLGYKAKPGFVIVRARIGRGGRKRTRPVSGRKPSKMGVYFNPGKSLRHIAEERVARKFVNLEVLNSYPVGEDGMYKFFEVVLVNIQHPQIRADKDVNWLLDKQHTRRVYRGLTAAGKKNRGLYNKGSGSTQLRPSRSAAYRRK